MGRKSSQMAATQHVLEEIGAGDVPQIVVFNKTDASGTYRIHIWNPSVVAVEGDDERTLRVAAGHLPDTPLPWQEGNASFAGHRDTFFRALRELRVGDDLELATTHGTFRYRVTRTLIVAPSDVSVLEPGDATALTLITCYPFTFLGAAPLRFVVQAERVGHAVVS